jgi:IS30 family transposase
MPFKKTKSLTLHEKSLVIQELKSGASVTNLAKKYDVAKSTICKIKKQREIIISCAVKNTYVGPGKRRTSSGTTKNGKNYSNDFLKKS